MPSPAELDAWSANLRRQYIIHLHHNLRKRVWPYWATLTHGIGIVGEPGGGVWRARTEEKLIVKVERWVRRSALSEGITDPEIRIERRP